MNFTASLPLFARATAATALGPAFAAKRPLTVDERRTLALGYAAVAHLEKVCASVKATLKDYMDATFPATEDLTSCSVKRVENPGSPGTVVTPDMVGTVIGAKKPSVSFRVDLF